MIVAQVPIVLPRQASRSPMVLEDSSQAPHGSNPRQTNPRTIRERSRQYRKARSRFAPRIRPVPGPFSTEPHNPQAIPVAHHPTGIASVQGRRAPHIPIPLP
jgi:hypothetical protein